MRLAFFPWTTQHGVRLGPNLETWCCLPPAWTPLSVRGCLDPFDPRVSSPWFCRAKPVPPGALLALHRVSMANVLPSKPHLLASVIAIQWSWLIIYFWRIWVIIWRFLSLQNSEGLIRKSIWWRGLAISTQDFTPLAATYVDYAWSSSSTLTLPVREND